MISRVYCIIREWDGTKVMVERWHYFTHGITAIKYSDGVTHHVSSDYFFSIFVRHCGNSDFNV